MPKPRPALRAHPKRGRPVRAGDRAGQGLGDDGSGGDHLGRVPDPPPSPPAGRRGVLLPRRTPAPPLRRRRGSDNAGTCRSLTPDPGRFQPDRAHLRKRSRRAPSQPGKKLPALSWGIGSPRPPARVVTVSSRCPLRQPVRVSAVRLTRRRSSRWPPHRSAGSAGRQDRCRHRTTSPDPHAAACSDLVLRDASSACVGTPAAPARRRPSHRGQRLCRSALPPDARRPFDGQSGQGRVTTADCDAGLPTS